MGAVFLAIYSWAANTYLHIGNFHFNMLHVFYAGIIFSLIGIVIGKIFLFVEGRR